MKHGLQETTIKKINAVLAHYPEVEQANHTINLCIFANICDPDIIDHIQRIGIMFYKRNSTQVKVS